MCCRSCHHAWHLHESIPGRATKRLADGAASCSTHACKQVVAEVEAEMVVCEAGMVAEEVVPVEARKVRVALVVAAMAQAVVTEAAARGAVVARAEAEAVTG
mmetsp:Transcript_25327/g.81899  ORF Transcript_25327/g.81899 Transcript_25327/m.81899 type:complete len:102 (+) Transcript_25327:472-777(+)